MVAVVVVLVMLVAKVRLGIESYAPVLRFAQLLVRH